jgi:hypothetical protein
MTLVTNKKARLRGPFPNVLLSAATVMAAMVVVPARGELNRLQFEAGNAGRDVQPGLSLHAERLQRVGVGGTANQEVAAAADADRGIGADAAIAAGEFAAPSRLFGAFTAQESWVCSVTPRSRPMRCTLAM